MYSNHRKPFPFLFCFVPCFSLLAVSCAFFINPHTPAEAKTKPVPYSQTPEPSTPPPFLPLRRLEDALPPLKPALSLPTAVHGLPPRYQARALPSRFDAVDLGDSGSVVGSVKTKQGKSLADEETTAALWKPGKLVYLPGGGEPRCYTEAINADGVIAGNIGAWSEFPGADSGTDIALWSEAHPRRAPQRLNPVHYGDHPTLTVTRLNRYGQILAEAGPGSTRELFIFETVSEKYGGANAGVYGVSFLRDGNRTHIIGSVAACDLNDRGQIIGTEGEGDHGQDSLMLRPPQHAMLYQEATGTLLWQDNHCAQPNAINNRGQVVGIKGALPVLWQHDDLRILPCLPNAIGGIALDINDRSQIVGHCRAEDRQKATL